MQQVKLFGDTDGIRGKANYFPLDVETIVNLGKALAEYVKKTAPPNPNREYRVIIGKDTRRSGYMIEQALTSGFLSRGVDVITIGPIPTPGLSHLVASFALDLGIQITASHNPASDNGIKVFSKNGSKLNKKEEEIIEDLFNKMIELLKNEYEKDKIKVGTFDCEIKMINDGPFTAIIEK